MQISFTDLQKLLTSAKKLKCLILMDDQPIDVVCHDEYIFCSFQDCDSDVFDARYKVIVENAAIFIDNRKIQIYNKPLTTQEILWTLESLKND